MGVNILLNAIGNLVYMILLHLINFLRLTLNCRSSINFDTGRGTDDGNSDERMPKMHILLPTRTAFTEKEERFACLIWLL